MIKRFINFVNKKVEENWLHIQMTGLSLKTSLSILSIVVIGSSIVFGFPSGHLIGFFVGYLSMTGVIKFFEHLSLKNAKKNKEKAEDKEFDEARNNAKYNLDKIRTASKSHHEKLDPETLTVLEELMGDEDYDPADSEFDEDYKTTTTFNKVFNKESVEQ